MFQRCMKAEPIYGLEHLRDRDLCRIIHYDRFLRSEAHICPTHALQPFQGLLHPNGAGPSRHSVYREDNRPSSRASTDAHRLIAYLPCCGRREADRRS